MGQLESPTKRARKRFLELHGSEPQIAIAPGRVNLVGEHTDYNDGYVLPMGIDLHVAVAFGARSDGRLEAYSLANEDSQRVDLDALMAPGGSGWFDYVAAVAWALADAGHRVNGATMVIAGNVPIGAGLSSSAALEVAVARALCEVAGTPWNPTRAAQMCQRGENRYVGVSCGIMDQYTAAHARAGKGLLLDCRELSHTQVTIPDDASFVVLDTGVRRRLAGSEYNQRRASCDEAVALIAARDPEVKALRDVTLGTLISMEQLMADGTYIRARHVVAEMNRPQQLVEALDRGDLAAAGRVMSESHFSLRDLYEVSSAALDEITELARATEGCYGARMTGAGFGGCAIALVETRTVDSFVDHMRQSYKAPGGAEGYFHACVPSDGAGLIWDTGRTEQ